MSQPKQHFFQRKHTQSGSMSRLQPSCGANKQQLHSNQKNKQHKESLTNKTARKRTTTILQKKRPQAPVTNHIYLANAAQRRNTKVVWQNGAQATKQIKHLVKTTILNMSMFHASSSTREPFATKPMQKFQPWHKHKEMSKQKWFTQNLVWQIDENPSACHGHNLNVILRNNFLSLHKTM